MIWMDDIMWWNFIQISFKNLRSIDSFHSSTKIWTHWDSKHNFSFKERMNWDHLRWFDQKRTHHIIKLHHQKNFLEIIFLNNDDNILDDSAYNDIQNHQGIQSSERSFVKFHQFQVSTFLIIWMIEYDHSQEIFWPDQLIWLEDSIFQKIKSFYSVTSHSFQPIFSYHAYDITQQKWVEKEFQEKRLINFHLKVPIHQHSLSKNQKNNSTDFSEFVHKNHMTKRASYSYQRKQSYKGYLTKFLISWTNFEWQRLSFLSKDSFKKRLSMSFFLRKFSFFLDTPHSKLMRIQKNQLITWYQKIHLTIFQNFFS